MCLESMCSESNQLLPLCFVCNVLFFLLYCLSVCVRGRQKSGSVLRDL